MVIPWIEIQARKWAEVGKEIAAHAFRNWLGSSAPLEIFATAPYR